MTGTIVCFSGKIGSGKSSVSRAIAQQLGCQRASFGEYVRQLLSDSGGDPNSRADLQDFGQSLVNNDARGFCEGLLSEVNYQAGDDLVIDGIRHVDIYNILTTILVPAKIILIHLEIGENLRRFRTELRGDDPSEIGIASHHHVERDTILALPKKATAIVNAEDELSVVVENCVAEIQNSIDSSRGF